MELTLSQRDQRVIWHPYTQHKDMLPPIALERAEGALLWDDQQNSYIDAISSWWVTIHGHAHPYIAQKIFEQATTLEHAIFTGFTHEPAVRLAERLLGLLPGNFSKIFYSDNGSTAVEVAVKMAIQFWRNRSLSGGQGPGAKHGRPLKILALKHAYHGDTFGAMSVSARGLFTDAFREYLFETVYLDTPSGENIGRLKSQIDQQADTLACFIYEPLLQAAGGMIMYEAAALDELLRFIQSRDILCIADEVMTGFGRTGKLFAGQYLQSRPDIICLSKGLTGGSMALGATACSERIFEAFLSADRNQTFFHGHSFTANPIGCSAALASLDLLEKEDCRQAMADLTRRQKEFAGQLSKIKGRVEIKNVRTLGTILAFEIASGNDGYLNPTGAAVTNQALSRGIYLRPLGNTIYVMPPYCISDSQLTKVHAFLFDLVSQG
jgi:adenosylmethionine---8-amino-7-oxononanoate aminotransferase